MNQQFAIALNMAGADHIEADKMLADLELSRGTALADWPQTFQRRASDDPAQDGWHGIILMDGKTIEWDGQKWR